MKRVLQRTALAAAFLAAISVFAGCKNIGGGGASSLPTKEYMVTVAFEKAQGTVTTAPSIPTGKKVKENTEITFTAIPNSGFAIDMWNISKGTFSTGGKQGDKTAKVKVTSDITITVTFKTSSPSGSTPTPETNPNPNPKDPNLTPDLKKHTVTITQTPHGAVSATPPLPTDNKVKEGDVITFTATPDQHYLVGEWNITGGTKLEGGAEGDTTAKVKVTSDVTVTVTFKGKTYYDKATGEGVVKGSPFTMKQIAAVTDGKLGHGDPTQTDNAEHTVSLTAYKIGETEVTQDVFEAVMGTNPSYFNGEDKKRYPVENVNRYQAIAFCNKLSLELGLEPCYVVKKNNTPIDFKTLSFTDIPTQEDADWDKVAMDMNKNGFRLPTEAEWEWAAKGGTENQWPGINDKEQLHNYAWYTANSGQKTHEVKTRKPNEYQLYDMSGNVAEWCWDGYDYRTPQGGKDPTGTTNIVDRQHIVRGGHWSSTNGYADRLSRGVNKPEIIISDQNKGQTGFRCVCRN